VRRRSVKSMNMINPKLTDRDEFELMIYHKRSVAKVSLFIGIPLFLAMAIKNFIRGDNIMAFSNCMELLILILLGFVIMRRIEEKSEYRIYSVLFRLFFAVMGVSLIYDIGFQSNFSRIEWCYIYPILVFLAVGLKEGAIWVSIFYGILAFLILNFDLQGVTLFQIQELRSRFLVSFFAVCILCLFLEQGFRRAQQRLLHHQHILKESENRYRQAYEQLNIEVQERKRAEEALLNAAQQWRTTFDGISDMVCLLDPGGKILRCNKAMGSFLKKPLSEIIGRTHWEIVHGTTALVKECPVERMWETRRRETDTLPMDDRWFSIAVDPLLDEAGRLIGAVHIMSDITEHERAEDALRESEDRYRDLVEYSQYLICTHDLKGRILSVNQGGARLLGYEQRDLLNKNIRDLLVLEVRDGFDTYLDTIRKDGVAKGLMLMQTATGEKRTWEYNNTLRTEGVTAPIVRAIAHDITERLQAEKVVTRLSQENAVMAEIGRIISSTLNIGEVYEHFAEGVRKVVAFDRIVINSIDIEKATVINVYMAGKGVMDRKVGEVYPLPGSGNAEMVRMNSTLLIQTEDFNEYKDRFPMLLSTFQAGFRSIMNVPLFSKGRIIGGLLLRSLKPYAYADKDVRLAERIGNQIAGAIANAQLFIERKRAEEELRENEKRLQALMDASPIGICWSDMQGNIEYNNRKFRELFGYTVDDIPTIAEWRRLAYPDPAYLETVPSLVAAIAEAQRQGRDITPIEVTITCKDGSTRYVAEVGALASNRILAVFNDLTERKQGEEALRRNQEELLKKNEEIEASRRTLQLALEELEGAYKELKATQSKIFQQEKMASIGQLAAGVAHEINNPMAFISSNLGTLDKYVNRLTEFIQTQSEVIESLHMTDAIEGLKRKQKELKLDYITEDIKGLITESLDGSERVRKIVQGLKSFARVDEAEYKYANINECIESTISIVWNELKYKATLKKDYGDLPLTKCYPQQINQVFMNLLINAGHAIESQGEITIKTWAEDGSIWVAISDKGHGIAKENLNKIFEPFFTTKEVGKGTGLGLSITYEIIQKHNGEITVESEVGKGTTFTVRIPIV